MLNLIVRVLVKHIFYIIGLIAIGMLYKGVVDIDGFVRPVGYRSLVTGLISC